MRFSRVWVAGLVLTVFASAASAQQTVEYASVSGRVTDTTGAVVPGAQVTATQLATNLVTTAVTNLDGRFRFPYLRVGPYEVTVRLAGFRDSTQRLRLTVGAAFDLPVTLAVAGLDSSVDVRAEATVLEAARSQIAGTVSQDEVEALPLNGRNFLEVALLVPGVSPTNIASTQLFPETSAVPGVTLSVSSQRNLSNNFIVDGLSANDDAAALSGITYGVDAIEQFQVVTSGAQAELGRALGGYVNVVTRSGTNQLRGTAYDFIRDDSLNARNALSGSRLPMDQSQFGASLGGPLVTNRTFYFANVERRNLDQTGFTTITDGNVAAINARLRAVGYGGPAVATGIYANPVDTTNVFGRIDQHVSDRDQFSVRYALYDVGSQNSRGAGGLNAPSASTGLDEHRPDGLGQQHAGAVVADRARDAGPVHAQRPCGAADRPDRPERGDCRRRDVRHQLVEPDRPRSTSCYQVVNNLSHQAGAHALRAGVDFLYNDDVVTYPRSARGSYSFSSLANFLTGVYNNAGFTQTFGVTQAAQTNPNLGFHVQDEWKATPALTFNLGLRYDLQFLETISTDTDNLSPRAGFAWVPFDSRRTIVRGSVGLFYDRVPLRAVANALLSAGNTTDLGQLQQIAVSLSPTQAGAPVFPAILDAVVPSVTLVNLTTMDRGLQNAYSRQASAEVEQQIGARTTFSAGYQYLRGRNLLMSINQNVPSCVASGSNNGCRPNPDYANNSQYSAAGASNYHGLHLSLAARPAGWWHYRLSYTLSKSMNNLGEFFFSSPIDPLDVSKDWGRSDDDQRHRLVLYGSVQSPMAPAATLWEYLTHGFQVGGMVQAYSAPPFNILSGVTTVQGTPGRPIVDGEFIDCNAGEGTRYVNVTARVSRTFRLGPRVQLEALVEAFNLTNHVNVVTRNTTFGPGAYPDNPLPAFGQVTAVGEPRSLQFGFRVRY